ncbi:MFS transporter [Paraburkholderia caballeronis]|uniref:MFS transporter n=1 Tax=Paraburkholderia caballeronis TaxID=416943 RepID=UPI001066DCCC|nr:MFS transporter [Paraburkholderia caballeronis]TDV17237.1 sugar transport protein [Paraburkholderia caballeronis]TDV17622.1 sugar transport protein [Paraburkholderia caballeronis]TDV27640.1 sugar transport protein [Paraburkholderia caballeronis]
MSAIAVPPHAADLAASASPVVIRSAHDVSRIVNAGAAQGSNARIVIAIALGGVFLDAYDLTSLAYGVKDIAREFALTPVQIGFVSAAITFGAILGALSGGYLTDRIGRYRVFMADMLFFVVAAIAAGLAPNAWVLGGARFLMGFGVGLDLPVAMAFLAEFSRVAGRGNKAASVAAWCPAWYAATSTCYLLILGLYAILPDHHLGWLWRFTLAFGAVPALAIILVRSRYISESPVWAANQGDLEAAARILKRSYGVDAVVERDASSAHKPRTASWRNFGMLFNATYRRRTILAATIGAASSFGYNAIIFGLPVIIASFLKQGPLTTIVAALLLNLLFAFVGGLIGVRTAPTVGAWKMTVLGHTLQFVSLIGLALIGHPGSGAFVVLAILLLGGYLFGQGFGPGSHSMTYASLSYPTSLRGIGVGFNQTLVRSASTVSLFLFPILAAALGTKVFWVIALAPLTSLVVLLAIRWEPSGYDIDGEDYALSRGEPQAAAAA